MSRMRPSMPWFRLAPTGASFGIGNQVSNGTANDVLFVGPTGLLAQNANFQFANSTNVLTLSQPSIGTTSTDSLILQNTTVAALGALQYSPRLRMVAQGWSTGAGATTQVEMMMEVVPVQDTISTPRLLVYSMQPGWGPNPMYSISQTGNGSTTSFCYTNYFNQSSGSTVGDGMLVGFDGSAYVWNRENGGVSFGANNAGRWTLAAAGHITPDVDNVYDSGGTANRMRTAYAGTSFIQGGALNLAGTSTDGLVLQNTSLATVGVQQFSPRLRLTGAGWGTTGGASQQLDVIMELQPSQSTLAQPFLYYAYQRAGGGYTPFMLIGSASVNDTRVNIVNGSSGPTAGDGLLIELQNADTFLWNRENGYMSLGANNNERWQIQAAGHFVVGVDNTYNVGATASTLRPANVYAANSFNVANGAAILGSAGSLTAYKSVTTAGWGVPAIYGSGRSTAQTAAVASVATYTVGAADGSFMISSNVSVTASTAHSFTVTCAYTDEGNVARTLTLSFIQIGGGTPIATITNVTGAGPYEGVPNHIRCKASTAITIATVGTFTTVTYNVEASIIQIA